MNLLRHAWRALRREALAGDLLTVFAALVLGVAVMTAVGTLVNRVNLALTGSAAEMLGGDLGARWAHQFTLGHAREDLDTTSSYSNAFRSRRTSLDWVNSLALGPDGTLNLGVNWQDEEGVSSNAFDGETFSRSRSSRAANAGYRAPARRTFPVTGRYGWGTIRGQMVNMRDGGFISAYDYHLGDTIAEIVTGGDIDQGSARNEHADP